MVTGYSDVAHAVQAMKAGASDFIEKPVRARDAARRASSARWRSARPRQAGRLAAEGGGQPRRPDRPAARGHGPGPGGQPSKNIAADLGISQRTVENHRAAIMRRTGASRFRPWPGWRSPRKPAPADRPRCFPRFPGPGTRAHDVRPSRPGAPCRGYPRKRVPSGLIPPSACRSSGPTGKAHPPEPMRLAPSACGTHAPVGGGRRVRNPRAPCALCPRRPHGAAETEARAMRSIILYVLGVPVVVIILLNVFNVI